jgi:hypothetical protein
MTKRIGVSNDALVQRLDNLLTLISTLEQSLIMRVADKPTSAKIDGMVAPNRTTKRTCFNPAIS